MIYVTGDIHGDARDLISRFNSIHLVESDIIVSATGNYNLFHKYINLDEILKYDKGHEKIFIDVEIINKDGKLVGDIPDFEIFNRENYYKTPVPKGVGLLTRVVFILIKTNHT